MRVIINPEVKKYLPYILIACIAATFLVVFVDCKYVKKYSDFVNVDAVITDVRREATYHRRTEKRGQTCLPVGLKVIGRVRGSRKPRPRLVQASVSSLHHVESQKTSYDILVTYEYSYNGEDYLSNRRELTKICKKTGKQVVIKCNPESPKEIQEVYERNIFAIITALLLLWDFFLWKGLWGIAK